MADIRSTAPRARLHASRAVTLTVLTALTLLLGSAPAWAHTELESSTPAANASVPTAPSTVALTFSEEIGPDLATITVTGPDGQHYESGKPTASGPTLNLALRPLGPAGEYKITYRVVSDDGHPVEGAVPFTLTTAGPGASAATSAAAAPPASGAQAPGSQAPGSAPAPADTATSEDSGSPVWPWIVGAVIVVLAGAGLALRRRKA
ncbi:MAG: copper resistance protein CopC [Pseudonocardia sp.]|nr:copper resistance protein CopC [Pseudonocardia sp.]